MTLVHSGGSEGYAVPRSSKGPSVWLHTHANPTLSECYQFISVTVGLPAQYNFGVSSNRKKEFNKLALYGTDGRLFTTDVSAKFKVT